MNDHRLPASICPVCGYRMDATTGVNSKERPTSGDLSICCGCGEVLVFAEDLSMRQADPMEMLRYQLTPTWSQVEAAQRMIRSLRVAKGGGQP